MMIVTCESCKAKFQLDPGRIKGAGSKVRCSRCKHIFYVAKDDDLGIHEAIIEPEIDDQEFQPKTGSPLSASGQPPAPPTVKKKPKQVGRYLLWVLLVTCIVAGIYLFLAKNLVPSFQPSPIGSGKTLPREKEKRVITILDSMQAYFLENENIGQIFVVEGEIRNDSPKPVSFVLLEGKLYTIDNKVYQNQKAYCANVMSRNELAKQTVAEIQNRMMNREGKDLLNVHVSPQGKVFFQVVFHNLPALNQLSDYSVAVVSSEIDPDR
jgi:predicted Zn finger-like uncharacterized protein